MNPIDGLAFGLSVAITPENLLAALVGALLGTAIGVLPGMSPTAVIALLLVPTMGLKPETGLIMLGAIYYGSQYGDSMTAILLNVPSEAASIVIAIDGYKLTRRGRSGAALAVSAVSSFIGATAGLIGLTLSATALSQVALALGPPEEFLIGVVGLVILSRMSNTTMWSGLLALGLGLLLTTIGVDPVAATPRFTFGQFTLGLGISLLPVAMGIIGLAEVLSIAVNPAELPAVASVKLRGLLPTVAEWVDVGKASLRSSVLGFMLGLLPGPTLTMATFAAHRLERAIAPEEVGLGSLKGVAGPKAADDAAVSANFVPLLALGIPFSSTTAVLFAGLLLHGITPGPLLIQQRPEIFWGLIAAMYVGNFMLLILNFPLVGMWVSLLKIPGSILSAVLVVLMLVGAYSLRNNAFDMLVLLIAGVVGYFMKGAGIDRALLILGMVLGPILELYFRQSLQMSGSNPGIFFERTICQVLLGVLVIWFAAPPMYRFFRRRRGQPALAHPLQGTLT
jgi:putative tricarboxylic transport membrane protein